MIQQVEFSLRPLPRGFHLVTNEVISEACRRRIQKIFELDGYVYVFDST